MIPHYSERGKKTRQIGEEVGRQHHGMDRPGVRNGPNGSAEQGKVVVKSSVVPQRPSRLRDRWRWWRWWWYHREIRASTEQGTSHGKDTKDCQEQRSEDAVNLGLLCLKFCSKSSVQRVGKTGGNIRRSISLRLKARLGTGEMGWFNDRTWGCGDCYNLHVA